MIGVVSPECQQEAVREFFELFKTPWEFRRPGRVYDVLLTGGAEDWEHGTKLMIVFGAGETFFDARRNIRISARFKNTMVCGLGERIPIYGDCATFIGEGRPASIEKSTGQPSSLVLQAEGATCVRVGFDLFAEVRFLLQTGQPSALAGTPTLELHIGWMRELILSCAVPVVEIPPVPDGHPFIACLTHDVDNPSIRQHLFDHTMFGFWYRALIGSVRRFARGRMSARNLRTNWAAAFLLPLVHLGLAKDRWLQFDRYLEIEQGLASTFYVIPRKGEAGIGLGGQAPKMRACRYDLADIAEHLRKFIASGSEVGVHGVDAWADSARGREELQRVAKFTGASEVGVRMHWLYSNQDSPRVLQDAGFSYDSTFGYNETVGYRGGTVQAFKPPGVSSLLELPLHIMDTALFYPTYRNLADAEAMTVVLDLVENSSRLGGVLTVNWHDRSLAPERLWGDFYERLIQELKERKAWFATAAQAVRWFRKRRAAIVESAADGAGRVRVKASIPENHDSVPGLRIRVFWPRCRLPADWMQRPPASEFTEVALRGSIEATVASGCAVTAR